MSFNELWSKHIDPDGWQPILKLTKEQWAFFIFGGVQNDDNSLPFLEFKGIKVINIDAPRMAFWFTVLRSDPWKIPGHRNVRFASPYLVVVVDKKDFAYTQNETLTFFFDSKENPEKTTVVKVEVSGSKEGR